MSIKGKTIVFTGKISKPRHESQTLVEENGGTAGLDVSKHTDYLVIGDKPGSKLVRAALLGIKTITEEDFMKLLEPTREDKEDDRPLTPEELKEIDNHRVTLTCDYCGNRYKQWDTLPDYGTCPVCETLSNPLCPNCKNNPIFVTDFKLYNCLACGAWFKSPHSVLGRTTKHIHYFCKTTETSKNIVKECPCGATLTMPNKPPYEPIKKYEPAYIIREAKEEAREYHREEEREYGERIRKWGEKEQEREVGEKKVVDQLKSLTSRELKELMDNLFQGNTK